MAKQLTTEEQQLLSLYRKLKDRDKTFVAEQMREWIATYKNAGGTR